MTIKKAKPNKSTARKAPQLEMEKDDLIEAMLKANRFTRLRVIESKKLSTTQWVLPKKASDVDVVIFDNLKDLTHAVECLRSAWAWCVSHNKPLWLVDQDPTQIKIATTAIGITPSRLTAVYNDGSEGTATMYLFASEIQHQEASSDRGKLPISAYKISLSPTAERDMLYFMRHGHPKYQGFFHSYHMRAYLMETLKDLGIDTSKYPDQWLKRITDALIRREREAGNIKRTGPPGKTSLWKWIKK